MLPRPVRSPSGHSLDYPSPVNTWRGRRGHFYRRIAILIILGVFAIFVLGAVTASVLFGNQFHAGGDGEGPPAQAIFMLIPIGFIMFTIIRGLRDTAAPIGAVMDAAERVADGDYGVHVAPSGSDEVRHLITSFNAMTARLHTNEEQRRMLLADIAHELRNPLAIIRGNVEGMIDGVYDRDDAQLNLVLDETAQMTRLLEDLHILSIAEAGMLKIHTEPVVLTYFLSDIVRALVPQAQGNGVELTVDAEGCDEVLLDPVRIRQVIENLITNSIRHTPSGGNVLISARVLARMVEIVVSDTGEGISATALPYIFNRFTKSADSGGTGLGLAIARRLIEVHGGTIIAESTPGAGTTISIRLPIIKA